MPNCKVNVFSRQRGVLALLALIAGFSAAACDTSDVDDESTPGLIVAVEGKGSVDVDTLSAAGEKPLRLLLTGLPEDGWYLATWEGDVVRSGNPDTLTLTSDETITAVFAQAVEPVYFDDIPFVEIPGGTFVMGGDELTDEMPRHSVTISRPFYLSMYAITLETWLNVMGSNPHPKTNDMLTQPVVMVDWQDVQDFIEKLNAGADADVYRLPTEAEWEFACRAGSTGDTFFDEGPLGDYAWYYDNWPEERLRFTRPVPVGLKRPNAFGLFDMLGNVWEWVQDAHALYSGSPAVDPVGPDPDATPLRSIRGGGDDSADHIRCNNRSTEQWHEAHYYNGFRIVREIDQAPGG